MMSRKSSDSSISSLEDISFHFETPLKPSTPIEKSQSNGVEVVDPIVFPYELQVLKVELGSTTKVPNPTLIVPEDVYEKDFFPNRHYNFIGATNIGSEGEKEYMVFSVRATPTEGFYRGVKNTKKGLQEFLISEIVLQDIIRVRNHAPNSFLLNSFDERISKSAPSSPGHSPRQSIDLSPSTGRIAPDSPSDLISNLDKKILRYLTQAYPKIKFYQVKNLMFNIELRKIEKKHPSDNNRCYKIAVIYSKPGQKHPLEMFSNTASPQFTDFLNLLGDKINLKGWQNYRGDFSASAEQESIYRKWNNLELMFHVSTMTNSEQHRRLIGNDIVVIFFQEESTFDPTHLDELGAVPQVFFVVQPSIRDGKTTYKLAALHRPNIKSFPPELPANHYFEKENFLDFFLTKVVNGFTRALHSPPMNRLFYTPRAATLKELAKRFSEDSKEKDNRRGSVSLVMKEVSKKDVNINSSFPVGFLFVKVISGRNLARKDISGYSDPYVVITIGDEKCKTTVAKKTLNPIWNEEFKLGSVDAWQDLHITCMDWDRIGSHDFMGQITIPLQEVIKYADQEVCFQLQTNEQNVHVSGDLLLSFVIKGES